MDDFEKQLQRQHLRELPPEWREDILSQARRVYSPAHAPRSTLHAPRLRVWLSTIHSQLSTLLWPNPRAWAGLTAIWLGLLAFNHAIRDGAGAAVPRAPLASSQMLMARQEQERLLVELIGQQEATVVEQPKPAVSRPRSERRRGFSVT